MKQLLLTSLIALLLASAGRADIITLVTGDGLGASSFNSAGGWSNAQPPSPGNDYVNNLTTGFLRTPANGDTHFFLGDSLTIGPGATLLYKGTGNTGIISIDDLILNGGILDHRNGSADVFNLAGLINVVSDSTVDARQGPIIISAGISGTGDLTFISSQTYATTTLSGANTLTGDYVVNTGTQGPVILDPFGSIAFTIGASGINNAITSTTAGTVNLNGEFDFELSNASANLGDAWQIVVPTVVANYGDTFAVSGFNETAPNVWSLGDYQFSEATGVLQVVPEPSVALSLLAAAGVLGLRRRR